jgi:cation:H+ antiporter
LIKGTLSSAILVFLISAGFVILAGIGLARFGDKLAAVTGWGRLWVGTLLVSIATSLPELTVNISAVWLEDSPGLALGNIFGANMLNMFVLAMISLLFGAHNLFGTQGRDTLILVLLGIGLVFTASLFGFFGDAKIGPTSLGGMVILVSYIVGMRIVYQAGQRDKEDEKPQEKENATRAWVGFLISALIVIIAARYLAASAGRIAELTGISTSFIGVLLVAIVTTLPETSVSVAAALRRSYGIVIGNVYGSCAFNIFVLFFADLFHPTIPLLTQMQAAHFAAATAAFLFMSMGYLLAREMQTSHRNSTMAVIPAILVLYVGALYLVFVLGQQQ